MLWGFPGPQQPGKRVGIAGAALQLPGDLSVKARGELWLQASSNLPETRVAGRLRGRGAAVASQPTLSLPSASIPGAGVGSALCVVQKSLGESCWELSWFMELLLHKLLPSLVFQELSWFNCSAPWLNLGDSWFHPSLVQECSFVTV